MSVANNSETAHVNNNWAWEYEHFTSNHILTGSGSAALTLVLYYKELVILRICKIKSEDSEVDQLILECKIYE